MTPSIVLSISPVAALYIALCSVGLGSLCWLMVAGPSDRQKRIRANLQRSVATATTAEPNALVQRPQNPSQVVTLGRRAMPAGYLRMIETLHARAGRPPAWAMDKVITLKMAGLVLGAVLGMMFGQKLGMPMGIFVIVGVAAFFFFAPDLLLYSKGTERAQAIQSELPDTLDQMSIAVEAGLGFDAAMNRVVRNSKTVLAQEFTQALQEIQFGQSRRSAYEDLNDRARSDDLKRFTRSIVQAETYGLAMSDVLKTQADEMRLKRRQKAEEKAMQIPVKITVPLMLFILPTLFIVVLGPVVLQFVH